MPSLIEFSVVALGDTSKEPGFWQATGNKQKQTDVEILPLFFPESIVLNDVTQSQYFGIHNYQKVGRLFEQDKLSDFCS